MSLSSLSSMDTLNFISHLLCIVHLCRCYCIVNDENILGAIFSIWDELKAAKSWEEVERAVWGDLNNYKGFPWLFFLFTSIIIFHILMKLTLNTISQYGKLILFFFCRFGLIVILCDNFYTVFLACKTVKIKLYKFQNKGKLSIVDFYFYFSRICLRSMTNRQKLHFKNWVHKCFIFGRKCTD